MHPDLVRVGAGQCSRHDCIQLAVLAIPEVAKTLFSSCIALEKLYCCSFFVGTSIAQINFKQMILHTFINIFVLSSR